jgi:hypothetical protein
MDMQATRDRFVGGGDRRLAGHRQQLARKFREPGRSQEWRGPPSRPKVQLGRLAGVGDGKVFRPPVMMAGPQLPDQLGRRHS